MVRRFTALAAVVLAAFASACDQSTPADPQVDGPSFVKPPSSTAFACVFSGNPSLSNSANSYFTQSADQKAASDFISAMQEAREAQDEDALRRLRENGFALLRLVSTVSRGSSPGDPAIGALLTKQDFNCMFDTRPNGADAAGFEGWPDDPHYDFEDALDPDNGGAYYVRGRATELTAPAIGNLAALNTMADPAKGNVSAIAPPSGSNWPVVLGQQVLFFGEPVTDGYDWKVLPRNAVFNPFAVVALCQGVNGGGQEYGDANMVHQFGVGVLGFIETGALCGTPPPIAALHGRGAFGMLARLTRSAAGFFSPEPLYASFAVATTRGGGASGAKGDPFTFLNLPTVNLVVTVDDLDLPKNTIRVNSGRFSVTVDVKTPAGEPAGGIVVSLDLTSNSGIGELFEITQAGLDAGYTGCDPNFPTPENPFVVPPQEITLGTVGPDGTRRATQAIWEENLCVNSTGAGIVLATSVAQGNPFAGIQTQAATKKISVKP